jgi:hypothetical protein
MITKLIDLRSDNTIVEADALFKSDDLSATFKNYHMHRTVISAAILKDREWDFPVTLFLYDPGSFEIE